MNTQDNLFMLLQAATARNDNERPRLLTMDEVYHESDVILERRTDAGMEWSLVYVLFTAPTVRGTVYFKGDVRKELAIADYGKTWRCWNFRNYIKAMETTPWEVTGDD